MPSLSRSDFPTISIAALAVGETIVWAAFYYTFPALLTRWEGAEGWGKTTLTAAFAGTIMLSALLAPFAGRLIDRGHGPALMTGAACVGAGLLALSSLTTSLALFVAIWLCLGVVMAGALYEPCFAVVTRALGPDARRAITGITLVAGFAGTLSFPMNHWIAEIGGWRLAAQAMAALALLAAAPLLWFSTSRLESYALARAPVPTRESPPPEAPGAAPSRRRLFFLLTLGFALVGAAHSLVLNHLLPILQSNRMSEDFAVLVAAGVGPMQVVGRLAILGFERHLSNRVVALTSCVAVGLAACCLLGAQFLPLLAIVFVVLQGSGYGTVSIMRPVMLRETLGDTNFGAISGEMARYATAAAALAPFAGSLLWLIGGYDLTLLVVAASCAVAFAAFAALAVRPDRPSTC
ncbi:MFS transporter [Aurantimonas sp. 22II-16-19i]|uniref:MFS transporter n=1 Tax=Aurantimonas sp. 22II-16-19i TaxID=1317114 RepID=UPI0009F7EB2D|nr:MFS transporter [Aurantimonas sp. 22II-16-19i]ORE97177.1 major facilitator superfamily transporter [Aurantimonas sp. 22II-16-19i]